MACFRSFRLVAAVSALLLAVLATSTRASGNACSETNGIRVQDVRLLIVPNADGISLQWTLSGYALVADPEKLSAMSAGALCRATIGNSFQVNKTEVCSWFYRLSGGDAVKSDGNRVDFSFSRRVPSQGPEIRLDRRADDVVCSDRIIVEIQPGTHRRFQEIGSLPKSLNDDRVEFEIPTAVDAKDLSIQVIVAETSGERNLKTPTSWREPIKGIQLQRLGRALLLSLLVALLFTFLERIHAFPSAFGQVSTYLRTPVTAAIAFYMTGTLTECARSIVFVILSGRPFDSPTEIQGLIRGMVFEIAREFRISNPYLVTELAVLVAILVTVVIARLLFALPARALGATGRVMAFPFRVTTWAAVIAVAAAVFAMLILKTESMAPWLGFEPPALIVSFVYALIGVGALRRLFGLSAGHVIVIAIVVTVTVLFPTDSVIKSSGEASIGYNARAWATLLSSFMAIFIYVAALTGFAFRVAGSDECKDRLAGQWLIFLLILLVAAFSIGHPTNALAVAGLMLISSHLLLPSRASPDETPLARGANIDWESSEETFPFIVGGVAAFIFLIQFAFAATEGDFLRRFALLDLAQVPRTFALGAVAGLVLARVGPSLRGDSAILKAANISAVLLVASVAASLVTLKGHFVAVLTANFGVVASLIICALVVYDLPRVKSSEGHLELRELFKGTTLAHAVPYISAMAVALFSALSPIFMHELTNSMGVLLRANLSQVQSSEDARKAQQSQSQVPRPQDQGGN